MSATLQSEARDNTRLFVRISEFSFAEFSVPIKHCFRCVPHPAIASLPTDKLPGHGLIQQISRWLRRPRGESTTLP